MSFHCESNSTPNLLAVEGHEPRAKKCVINHEWGFPLTIEQFISDEALTAKLQVVLQTWPLYRAFLYTGADQVEVVPKYLNLFCDSCGKETFWETSLYGTEKHRDGFNSKSFKCRNCGSTHTTYHFFWKKKEKYTRFFKVGQYPELEERVSKTLEGALTAEDLTMYKNALRLRNFNLCIAAVA